MQRAGDLGGQSAGNEPIELVGAPLQGHLLWTYICDMQGGHGGYGVRAHMGIILRDTRIPTATAKSAVTVIDCDLPLREHS
eukprot:118997-Pleurochrysis_carterae.AAC.1